MADLPFGLGRKYRNWRHWDGRGFEMNFTAFPIVLETASEPDMSAEEASKGFFCMFRKALAE